MYSTMRKKIFKTLGLRVSQSALVAVQGKNDFSFAEVGLDSLELLGFIMDIEKDFGIVIEFEKLNPSDLQTLSGLIKVLGRP